MLRSACAVALAAPLVAAHSHVARVECDAGDAECVLRSARGSDMPAWVAQFSTQAAGPEQLWVSYGATPDAAAVRWCTNSSAALPVVAWGASPGALTQTATGSTEQYNWGLYTSPFIHTVNLTGLPLNSTVYYRVGDAASGQSPMWSFPTSPGVGSSSAHYPYTTALLADVGESPAANATVQRVLAAVGPARIRSAVIVGDIAYASGCEDKGCTTWDAWGRLAEPLARVLPWMVTLGNHEQLDNFDGILAGSATYRYRGMPTGGRLDAGTGLQYFSWSAGPVHYVSFNSFYGLLPLEGTMSKWIEADLAAVDRTVTPWIVALQHAPWYNSNEAHQGNGEPARLAFEKLFISAGVSLVVSGHVHAYERSTPVANNVVQPPGPGSMVHVNIGDGGAGLYTGWVQPQPAWSAYRNATWGHGRWTVVNATHSYFSWHDNDVPDGELLDQAWILNANAAAWAL